MTEKKIMDYAFSLTEELAKISVSFVGLFPRGHVSLVVGEPGIGKTWFMLGISKALADGVQGLGSPDPYTKGKALIFAGETGLRLLANRLYSMGGVKNVDNIKVFSSQFMADNGVDVMMNTAIGRQNVADAVKAFRPDVVFIDTLISFMEAGKDESSQADMTDGIRGLSHIAQKYNCAVVIIHHFRKRKATQTESTRSIDEVIGSSAFTRLAALIIAVERKNNTRWVKCLKSWWQEFKPFTFTLETKEDGVRLNDCYDYDSDGVKTLGNAIARVRAAVMASYGEGGEFTLADIVAVSGISRNTVSTAIQAMLTDGTVTRTKREVNTQFFKVGK